MRKVIHHLRKQPERVRQHILHVTTMVFAVILILLWVYSLGASLTSPETQERVSRDLQPFSALKDGLIGGYNSISE